MKLENFCFIIYTIIGIFFLIVALYAFHQMFYFPQSSYKIRFWFFIEVISILFLFVLLFIGLLIEKYIFPSKDRQKKKEPIKKKDILVTLPLIVGVVFYGIIVFSLVFLVIFIPSNELMQMDILFMPFPVFLQVTHYIAAGMILFGEIIFIIFAPKKK